MVLCERCGKHNEDYCNYCGNEGNELSTFQRKLMFKENQNDYCDVCGHETKSNQTYCPGCGKLLSQVVKEIKAKTSRRTGDNYQNNDRINNLNLDSINAATGAVAQDAKNMFGDLPGFLSNAINELRSFDYVSFITNNISTALKTAAISIVIMIICILAQLQFGRSLVSGLFKDGSMEISYFKQILFGLASMNGSKIVMSGLLNSVNIGIAARIIITPIITGCIIYLATRMIYGKREVKSLPTAVLCAFVYAIISMVISLFARQTESMDSFINIKVYIGVFSAFINGFIISFIANILALEKENSRNIGTLSNIFKKNLFTLGTILLVTTIVIIAWTYIKLGSFTDILYAIEDMIGSNYLYGSLIDYLEMFGFSADKMNAIWFVYIVIIGLIASSWTLLMSHLISLKFATMSMSIFSLVDQGEGLYILLILIPIATLIMIGRMIKKRHGEYNHNIIGIYSICYTTVMGLISYFSTITINGSIPGMDSSDAAGLVDSAGKFNLVIGTNLFVTIITVFIFSTVFMYIGYKTKKIEN